MNRSLIIQFNGAVIKPNAEGLHFENEVIHVLYQLNSGLGYQLSFFVDNKQNTSNKKALDILEREKILFSIIEKAERTNTSFIITKKENSFTISQNESAIDYENWSEIFNYLKALLRKISHSRKTNETEINIELNPDGSGIYNISTGLHFFNHMLEQFAKHSSFDLKLNVRGDLHIDEHHTIEDTAIVLGEAMITALSNKKGLERYGFLLPMDDCLAQVAIDFGGRSWLVWNVVFKREKIGDVPTEMFYHFFKSFSDAAKCNLNIKAAGFNEHHKIESIFKAFAKAVKMAVAVNYGSDVLPTTKGVL